MSIFISSIRGKLLIALVALQLVLFIAYSLLTSTALREGASRNLEVNAAQTAEIINLALTPYSADGKLDTLQDFFDELIRHSGEGIVYLVVEDSRGRRLLTAGRPVAEQLAPPTSAVAEAIESGIYHHRQKILLRDNEVGVVQFGLATGNVLALLGRLTGNALWLGALTMAIVTVLALLIGTRFNRRLQGFMNNLDSIASGHYDEKLTEHGKDELSQLAANINRMADAVWLREKTFTSVFNSAPVPITLMRFDAASGRHLIDNMNQAALMMFDCQLDQLIGQSGRAVGAQVDADSRRLLVDTIERHPGTSVEIPITDRHGRRRRCLASGKVFEVFGVRYMIVAVVDVSELRQVEEELLQLNMRLEDRVAERTQALHAKNEELGCALANLHQAQAQLVQAEKLSSLGRLVAAVAHELNTPIGNALTVATTQQAHQKEFRSIVESGLTRSAMQRHLDSGDEATRLLVRNLERAAELVTSFKEVAVDRTSSQRRPFDLDTVIHEIVLTLQPTLKKLPFRIETSVQEDMRCDSFPGPLGQIITNLITNATTHAFEDRDAGTIRIEARRIDDISIRLSVSDDGRGIKSEHLGRIFDPFFTTRLGQGGSGLGLNIVYNLVTGLLGGKISVESTPGVGTCFHIDMPLIAPDEMPSDAV